MTHYLRDKNNNTIVDLECWNKQNELDNSGKYTEVSCSVDIKHYSNFLLNYEGDKDKLIMEIDSLAELRGWLWEVYFSEKKNCGDDLLHINEKFSEMFKAAERTLGLIYITD